MPNGKFSLLLLLSFVSVFLAVAGGQAFVREASCAVGAGNSDIARVQLLVSDKVQLGFSDQCAQTVLENCFFAIRSVYGRASGQKTRDALLDACDRLAGEVLGRAPAQSYAWLIRSTVAGERAQWAEMRSALLASQITTPNQGWLARRRIVVGELYYSELNDRARAMHRRDIATAVQTKQGRTQVALIYIQHQEARERIIQAVESLSGNVQNSFLSTVRSMSADLGTHVNG